VNDERIVIQEPDARSEAHSQMQGGANDLKWQRISSEQVADCRVFRVRRERFRSPRDQSEHDFFSIEAPDWINVIPVTVDGHIIMIEQYRPGTDEVTLEIPGGMVDEGEEPLQTAGRELFEETGYRPREILLLGRARPNPAIQNNWVHTYLARDCLFASTPVFDATEHTRVRLVPLANASQLIANGTITHALVITAFHWLSLFQIAPEGRARV